MAINCLKEINEECNYLFISIFASSLINENSEIENYITSQNLIKDINEKHLSGLTILQASCGNGRLNDAKKIIKLGANVHAVDQYGDTSLHWAALGENLEVVKHLFENYFKDKIDIVRTDGSTPLHLACRKGHSEAAQKLIELGANVNAVDKSGSTSLHWAAFGGNLQVVEYLFENYFKDKIDIVRTDGSTPLHLACGKGHSEAAQKLIELGANVNAVDKSGNTSLHWAALGGNLQVVEYLFENYFKDKIDIVRTDGSTPLHLACGKGHSEAVQKLIELGANVHAVDKSGNTSLHRAAISGNPRLVKHLFENYFKDKIDIVNTIGAAPLHLACENGCFNAANKLIELGANVNAVDEDGFTILHYAARGRNLQVVKHIFENYFKDKIDIVDTAGATPLHLACKNGRFDAANKLIELGANVHAVDKNGRSPHTFLKIVPGKKLPSQLIIKFVQHGLDAYKTQLMHMAAMKGDVEIMQFLVEKFPGIENSINQSNEMPYLSALKIGDDVKTIMRSLNFLAELKSVPAEALHQMAKTPLLFVGKESIGFEKCANEDFEIIKKFIAEHFKNDLEIKDEAGKTLLLNAVIVSSNFPLTKALIENGSDVSVFKDPEFVNMLFSAANSTSHIWAILKYLIENQFVEFTDGHITKNLTNQFNGNLKAILESGKLDNVDSVLNKLSQSCYEAQSFDKRIKDTLERAKLAYEFGFSFFNSFRERGLSDVVGVRREYGEFIEANKCIEVLLNPNHYAKDLYANKVKDFVSKNPHLVAEIKALKQNETFVNLSKILSNRASSLKLSELLKIDHIENAAQSHDFHEAKVMKGAEKNQGIKIAFKHLFKEYVVENGNDSSLENKIIGRMLRRFKLEHGYRPIAEFSSRQPNILKPYSQIIGEQMIEDDASYIQNIDHALNSKDLTAKDLKILVAAAHVRPKERDRDMTEFLVL